MEGEGTTVVGALVAILLAGWFPVCCWLRLPADELALVVVVEVVEAEAVDDAATLVSGWVRFCCCCCCCCCSWRLR